MPNTQHAYDHVAGIYLPIAIGVFAAVVAALAVLLVFGARRRRVGSVTEAPRAESAYAVLLGCVVGVLVWVTFTAETPIDRLVSRPALRVQVIAGQWSWLFRYANGTSVVDDSTWQPAAALVPVGVEVEFDGSSTDVIHGFWVPALHYLRQLFPGYVSRFDLVFTTAGTYSGTCAVYCGLNHSQMRFAIKAVSEPQFRKWLADRGR